MKHLPLYEQHRLDESAGPLSGKYKSAGFEEMTKADEMGFQGCEPGGLILTTDEFVVIYGRSAESP